MARCVTELVVSVNKMEAAGLDCPTAFEIETVMAYCQMVRWHVDVAVIEVGMGGRNDATNIIEKPALTVFTKISRDHTAFLGDTIEEIAYRNGWIDKATLEEAAKKYGKSTYGAHLKQVADGKILY